MLETVLLFFAGLILLVKGSDVFVNSAASIAKKLGVSELIIGLTLVAVGTSIPEYASAVISSLEGQSDLITGNIIGSNINNIALIIGISAFFKKIKISPEVVLRDGYIMLFSGALFYVSILNGRLGIVEGALFLILYLGYIVFLFEANLKSVDGKYRFREFIPYFFKFQYLVTLQRGIRHNGLISLSSHKPRVTIAELKLDRLFREALLKDILLIVISGIAIVLGANYFVNGAVFFAETFSIPKTFMGVLLAFGTTIPELSVSLVAVRRGYGDISIGNIVGSCIMNILLIVGTAALIHPVTISGLTLNYTTPAMLSLMIVSVFFMATRKELGRKEALIISFMYLLYMLLLVSESVL